MHYLRVTRTEGGFDVCYQRYTLRYDLDMYDEDDHPVAQVEVGDDFSDSDTYSGPIFVYPRKKRFKRAEVEAVWRATAGRCHICGRQWQIDQRGRHGWHIDHVVPHIGGGPDVEVLSNFRVACARCNLQKGRGYTETQVRLALRELVGRLLPP